MLPVGILPCFRIPDTFIDAVLTPGYHSNVQSEGNREDSPRVLVVDDEQVIREILSDFLTLEGYVVKTVEDGETALRELRLRPYDLVISDLKMPRLGGLELLERIASEKLNVLTIIMTGFGTVETAIEAMKKGAYDYILKPFKVEEVVHIVRRGLERQRLQAENIRLREAVSLYRVSEAVASCLEIDRIIDGVIDAACTEGEAAVVCLHLRDDTSYCYDERTVRHSPAVDKHDKALVGSISMEELLGRFRQDHPVLAHGIKASRYFESSLEGRSLVSFTSVPMKVRDQVIGMLSAISFSRGKKFDEGHRKLLAILASRAAVSIENANLYEDLVARNRDLEQANRSLEENFCQTIVGFARALEESDRYTRGHSERVAAYARLIAEGMRFPNGEVETVVQAALMHDIGKIGIRYEKLNKPGKLTPEEVAMFRTHPAKGKRILEPIPFMRELIPGCFCHHESFDGGGYPQALIGEEIPLLGRIVAVADTYDAMTSDRAYRKALPHHIAVAELERCSGTQFDPTIVDVFIQAVEDYRRRELSVGNEVPH
ncbi:MAG: HD domain-containing phosphohydrolase [Pseudomonadota bacterium]